jgi:hypothetical protein
MHFQEKNKLSNLEKDLSSLIEPEDLSHFTEVDKDKNYSGTEKKVTQHVK